MWVCVNASYSVSIKVKCLRETAANASRIHKKLQSNGRKIEEGELVSLSVCAIDLSSASRTV